MAEERRVFSTRVALRVFASLAAAAVIPLAILVGLVTLQVSGTLEGQARRNLAAASRGIGQQILDRLIIAEEALEHSGSVAETDRTHLDGVVFVTDGIATLLRGDPFEIPDIGDVGPEQAALHVQPAAGTQNLFISRRTAEGMLVGKLSRDYLWQATTLLPFATDLCVIDSATRSFLFCSEPPSDAARSAMLKRMGSASGVLEWQGEEGTALAEYWELFLPSRFAAAPWGMFVSQPEDIALAPLHTFNRVFATVAAIGFLITLLLAAGLVRRTMEPLDKLLAGTKRFADRDFSSPIQLHEQNEFSELAAAMNDMAERLDGQFETITALADIDRLILSSQSINEVLERVLDRIIALSTGYCGSVLLLDPGQTARGQLFSRLPDDAITTLHARITLTPATRAWLAGVAAGSLPDVDWLRRQIPELPAPESAVNLISIPIFRADELRGAMLVQIPAAETPSRSVRSRLSELAGRLAVAVSAADHESELFRRAHFDTLTGLPNRQLCLDRLYQAIAQARREHHRLALLFIDLDRFKNINDTLGHALGDELLKEIAFRLTTSVRETDTVARLGGDEFVIILPHIDGVIEIEQIVAKIHDVLGRPFPIGAQDVGVSASIGITIFPDHATDADSMLQRADTAMYVAKDSGRARIEFFEEEMDRSLKERLRMQQDLREAFRKGQFNLVYQPQLNIETGKLIGMEALLRWHHPQSGPISPGTFVPVLEDMGLIGAVGRWVIESALAAFAAWRIEGLCLPRIAINVSGLQLQEEDFEAFVTDRLAHHEFRGEDLELELTEHSLVKDLARPTEVLGRLGGHGIRIAIDDFGTGYSSLGYLQGLKFDSLKIDRAFVQGLPSEKSVALVEAVLGVARALGKNAIAEGIDSEQQRVKLLELGCCVGQGYLLSLPIGGDEVVEWSRRLDQTSVIRKLVEERSRAAV